MYCTKTLIKFVSLASLLIMGQQVFASISCSGPVTVLGFEPSSGDVFVSVGGLDHTRVCSVKIEPESCKVTYSALLAARASNKSVVLNFIGDGKCGDRSLFPAWAYPNQKFYYLEQ